MSKDVIPTRDEALARGAAAFPSRLIQEMFAAAGGPAAIRHQ
jgi:hypothetical protein